MCLRQDGSRLGLEAYSHDSDHGPLLSWWPLEADISTEHVGLCSEGCCFMRLQLTLFLFFWVFRNQTENGLPTQKGIGYFFLNDIALPESSGHLSDKKL